MNVSTQKNHLEQVFKAIAIGPYEHFFNIKS